MELKTGFSIAVFWSWILNILQYDYYGLGAGNVMVSTLIVAYIFTLGVQSKKRTALILNILVIPLISTILTPLAIVWLESKMPAIRSTPFFSTIITSVIAAVIASFYIKGARMVYGRVFNRFFSGGKG